MSMTRIAAAGAEVPRVNAMARPALLRTLLIAAALLAWEIATRALAATDLVAPPSAILRALFTTILPDAGIRNAIAMAAMETVIAYALAVSGGLFIGIAIGWTNAGRRSLFPVVLLLYAIPQAVLLPLFTLGFGIGPAAKIAFGFSHGVFPIAVNVISGMRGVNPLYLKAARAMGAKRRDVARNVVLPHMMSSLFAGLRLAMTMTLLGVILAELYVSTAGVGYFTRLFADNFDPAPLFALIGVLAAMAIALNEIVRLAERRLTRWRR